MANEPELSLSTVSEAGRRTLVWAPGRLRCFICEQTNSTDALTSGATGKLKLSPLVDDALCMHTVRRHTSSSWTLYSLYNFAVDDINHSLSELFELTALAPSA